MKEYAILYDTTRCTGCNTCSYRCIQEFGEHDPATRGAFRTVVQIKDDGLNKKQCMHCKDPQCVKACKSGAFTKSAYGPVLFDAEKCKGDKKCVEACPFKGVAFDDTTKKVVKCSMCAHRVSEGKEPACVEACPSGALHFGEHADMAALAKQMAAKGKLKMYGLKENGGTNVIILTKADPAVLGYPKVGMKAVQVASLGELSLPLAAGVLYAGFKKLADRKAEVSETKHEQKSK